MAKDIKRASLRALARQYETSGFNQPRVEATQRPDVIYIYNPTLKTFKTGDAVAIEGFFSTLSFETAQKRMNANELVLKAVAKKTGNSALLATTLEPIQPGKIGRARKKDLEYGLVKFAEKTDGPAESNSPGFGSNGENAPEYDFSHRYANSVLESTDEFDAYRILARSEPAEGSNVCVCALCRSSFKAKAEPPLYEHFSDGTLHIHSGVIWESNPPAWVNVDGSYPNACHIIAGKGIRFSDGGRCDSFTPGGPNCKHGKDGRMLQISVVGSDVERQYYDFDTTTVMSVSGYSTEVIRLPEYEEFSVMNPFKRATKTTVNAITAPPTIGTTQITPRLSVDSLVACATAIETETASFPTPQYADVPTEYEITTAPLDVTLTKSSAQFLTASRTLKKITLTPFQVPKSIALDTSKSDVQIRYVSGVSCGEDGNIVAQYTTLSFGFTIEYDTIYALDSQGEVVTDYDGAETKSSALTDVTASSDSNIPVGITAKNSERVVKNIAFDGEYVTDVSISETATAIGEGASVLPIDVPSIEGQFQYTAVLRDIDSDDGYIAGNPLNPLIELALRPRSNDAVNVVTGVQIDAITVVASARLRNVEEDENGGNNGDGND